MANHVRFEIVFHKMNDMARAKLQNMQKRAKPNQYEERWFGDLLRNDDLNEEIVRDYNWMLENVGPKWCHIDNIDDEIICGYSAWCEPEQGLSNILRILSQYDPEMVTYMKYEDEMPNFWGVTVFKGEAIIDARQDDSDEIHEMMMESIEGLNELYNDEDEEFSEEGFDLWSDTIWEKIDQTQDEVINEILETMEEE